MKRKIHIRFYEELNDFLPVRKRKKSFDIILNGRSTIKDVIESQRVPHTEIDLILVNGESVRFDYIPDDGDQVSVYPVFETFDISGITRLRPEPLRETRFILDVHLGKLARKLRMIGFDTLYRNDYEDDQIIEIGVTEKRIILTRDIGILKNKKVTHGYYLRSNQPEEQLKEVIRHFDLVGQIRPLNRCIACNGFITRVDKADVEDRLLPKTRKYFEQIYQCKSCGKLYWEGSHYKNMMRKVEKLIRYLSMRKILLYIAQTLDGFIASTDGSVAFLDKYAEQGDTAVRLITPVFNQ